MPTPRLIVDISMSLDGFVAGPNQTLEEPLGRGGDQLHEWVFGLTLKSLPEDENHGIVQPMRSRYGSIWAS